MTPQELADILTRMYLDAPYGETATMVHLFGIRYADEIRSCRAPITEIVRISDIPDSYHTEVSKMVKLARYVTVRPD